MDDIELKNFFVQCLCTRDLRFDRLEQVRRCPDCGREVVISKSAKRYLLAERVHSRPAMSLTTA